MAPTTTLGRPAFEGHHYGVHVSELAQDGDWVAHGHIEPRRFIAACNRQARTDGDVPHYVEQGNDAFTTVWKARTVLYDLHWPNVGRHPTYTDLLTAVQHAWAVRLPKRTCREDLVLTLGCDEHDLDPDPDAWALSWDEITADTPGAFPITLGLWS